MQCPTPIGKRFGLTSEGEPFRRASVAVLLLGCSPSDIARFVVTLYLNAIKGMFGTRTFPNISKELFKGFKSKLYTATPVVAVRFVSRALTSAFSFMEGAKFRGAFVADRLSVGDAAISNNFILEAPTTFGVSTPNIIAPHFNDLTTRTTASPKVQLTNMFDRAESGQTVKGLTCNVDKAPRGWYGQKLNAIFGKVHRGIDTPISIWTRATRPFARFGGLFYCTTKTSLTPSFGGIAWR